MGEGCFVQQWLLEIQHSGCWMSKQENSDNGMSGIKYYIFKLCFKVGAQSKCNAIASKTHGDIRYAKSLLLYSQLSISSAISCRIDTLDARLEIGIDGNPTFIIQFYAYCFKTHVLYIGYPTQRQ
jgi:hypothetical protein